MKVLFFTNIPSPYRVDFFNELGKCCDLTVLYERFDADDRDDSWLKTNESSYYKAVFLRGKKVGADTALCYEVIHYWKDPQYDIRIVGDYATPTGILSILYMRLHRIPYGIELDGGYIKPENGWITKIKRCLISGSSFAFSPGETTDQYLLKYGMRKDRIFFYPFSSLRLEDIKRAEELLGTKAENRAVVGIKEDKIVLFVGQMIYRKGIDVLLHAAELMDKSIGICIVGGKAPGEYERFVEEKALNNVHFVDFMAKQELARYYAAADIFVLPTREDIWGLVIGEAMSFGLPVVTTNRCVAGIELVSDKGGALVEADDSEGLAKAIGRLLDDKKAEQCRSYNLKTIRNYTIENMVQSHMTAFSMLRDLMQHERKCKQKRTDL